MSKKHKDPTNTWKVPFPYPGENTEDITAYILADCPHSKQTYDTLKSIGNFIHVNYTIYVIDDSRPCCLPRKKIGKLKSFKRFGSDFYYENSQAGNKVLFDQDTKKKITKLDTFPRIFVRGINQETGLFSGEHMYVLDNKQFQFWVKHILPKMYRK